jgi:hypothetical protein
MVRRAEIGDTHVVAQLLHDFNREFGEATPPVGELADRMARLLEGGDTAILLAGDGPDGVAVLRFSSRSGVPASSAISRSSTSRLPSAAADWGER